MLEHDFSKVMWGPDDAKGDRQLASYFVRIPEYPKIITGHYRYIVGRKGSGKTAVCEHIRLQAEADPLAFCSTLSLRNFPLPILRELRDRSYRDKSQFVPIWMFLIAVEVARLALQDNGALPPDAVAELSDFLNRNFPREGFGFAETLKHLQKANAKVSVVSKWLGGEVGREKSTETTTVVHYAAVTDMLVSKLERIESESSYFLLMDELDEGYMAGDPNIRLTLLALLRATEDLSLRLSSSGVRFRPLLVLRSDIFDRLEDNDLNKLDDYTIHLAWRADSQGGYGLKQIAEARIRASVRLGETDDPWRAIAIDDDHDLPPRVKGLWRYISTRTFERPRDIVKFLKLCSSHQPRGRLSFATVEGAELGYSDWLYRELRDEIHSYLPVWREALQCLTRLGSGVVTVAEFENELSQIPAVRKWVSAEGHEIGEIPNWLFEFGIIGNLDHRGRWLFKYKDDDLTWNPNMKIIVHFGFHKKLRIRGKSQDT